MISAAQTRAALALLSWTLPTLAKGALLTFDDVSKALDDVQVLRLGGLQLGAIRRALEAAGLELISESDDTGSGVTLREAVP